MGTLTDNLLKLTEFPFSYSLISLLTLIFLREGLLDQPLEKLAPLLILMGFVATTLSIIDPLGALQKRLLKNGYLSGEGLKSKWLLRWFLHRQESQKVSKEKFEEMFEDLSEYYCRRVTTPQPRATSGCLQNTPSGSSYCQDSEELSEEEEGGGVREIACIRL